MKYTNGPWTAKPVKENKFYSKLSGGNWSGFAKVLVRTKDTLTGSVSEEEEGQGNVKLILQSPDVYEAIK